MRLGPGMPGAPFDPPPPSCDRRRHPSRAAGAAAILLGALALAPHAAPADATGPERMLEAIDETVALTRAETGVDTLGARVVESLRATPRDRFVPPWLAGHAWENRPLPIGHGQTISQPYIVALMTELLAPDPGDVVLEVGTGSGYQAAVLAPLVARVYTMEVIEPLATAARARLAALGYRNVEVRLGDGYDGWPAHAPFDGIIVTAAAGHVPPPLVAQLGPGGRMVIPVGAPFTVQHLLLIEKDGGGEVTSRQILPVRFVPLTGGH